MNIIKATYKSLNEYVKSFVKWIVISIIVGCAGGIIGSVFHLSVDYVTEVRQENGYIILLLPIGGLIITAMYSFFRSKGKIDTNCVIAAAQEDRKVPFVMMPLIFVSTVITHFFGGSAGREGAALQLGGSLGYNIGRCFKLDKKDLHLIVMSGMSGVFSALFGTPLTATIFALEVIAVGNIRYAGLVPCLVSALSAYEIAMLFGISPVRFGDIIIQAFSVESAIKVVILASLCAIVSIVFCVAIKKSEHYAEKFLSNSYLKAFVGGLIIVVLTFLLNTSDYNGAGMDIITRAIHGNARPEAFILKIIFTVITISAGFKGGEIVPTFFIGSTFGCVMAPVLGLDASFGAAIGFVALFCGMVNCPIASIMLALEVFGVESILLFALACGVSFMLSGNFSLYDSQRIVFSKLRDEYIN